MDEFVLNYTLERLEDKIDDNKQEFETYKTATAATIADLVTRTTDIEDNETSMTGTINSLITIIDELQSQLDVTKAELNKVQLAGIKQEIVVRTLHNLEYFEAHDMHVDTFADTSNIDWARSIRGEWFSTFQAIGRTSDAYVKLSQTSVPDRLLISADGSSDEAVIQSFKIDKTQGLGKISFFAEAHNANSWRPIEVNILEYIGGTPIASATVATEYIYGDWVDVTLPTVSLNADQEYFIQISTQDAYGYRIGMNLADTYLTGTSYGVFGGVHSDNNHDIGFKVWCYPAADENDATIITNTRTLSVPPVGIVFEAEDVIIDGVIQYFVSRDNGANWKILQPGIETSLEDLPEGNQLVLKVYIMGGSRINAWGYVLKRGDMT